MPDEAVPPAPALNPTHLLDLGLSFAASRTLLSAVELDVFAALTTPLTAEQLRKTLNLHPRSVPDFPDALVALNVLSRSGKGSSATYANTPEAAAFLVPGSPAYLGGFLRMSAHRLYKFWDGLTDGLRTGQPQNEAKTGGEIFGKVFETEEGTEGFLQAMASQNTPAHAAFARRFDFGAYGSLLDVGGAGGQLCVEVVKANPHMRCVSYDLDKVCRVARRRVAEQGMEKSVRVVEGNFWEDEEFEKADVVVMSLVLHDYALERKKVLMKKAFDALPDGGALVAIEMLIDDDRRRSVKGLLMSLNMIIETHGGFDYTGEEFGMWAREIGFTRHEVLPLLDPLHAVVAYK